MTSTNLSTQRGTALQEFAIVARVAGPAGSGHVQPGREHVLDHSELTDLVHEAIAESQRVHGVHGHTLWGDAAEAAALILQHVAALCGADPGQTDTETESSGSGGVSADHA